MGLSVDDVKLIQSFTKPDATGRVVKVEVQSSLGTGLATEAKQDTTNTSVGATTEAAAASDTATSGLNGLLKRLLQRLTVLINSFSGLITADPAAAPTQYRTLTVNATGAVIKATPGNLYGWSIQNLDGAVIYVKFYDKATAPTSGDTPVRVIQIAANGSAFVAPNCIQFAGLAGLGVRAVAGSADNNNVNPGTAPIIEVQYK